MSNNCPAPFPTQTLYGTSYYTNTIYYTVTRSSSSSSEETSSSTSSSRNSGGSSSSSSTNGGGNGGNGRREVSAVRQDAVGVGLIKKRKASPAPAPAPAPAPVASPLPSPAPEVVFGLNKRQNTYVTSTVSVGSNVYPTATLYSTPACNNNGNGGNGNGNGGGSSPTPSPSQGDGGNNGGNGGNTSQQNGGGNNQSSSQQQQQQPSQAASPSSMTTMMTTSTLFPTTDSFTTRASIEVTVITTTQVVLPTSTSSSPSSSSSADGIGGTAGGIANPSSSSSDGGDGASKGAIAGGVVGGVVGAAILLALLFALMRKRRKDRNLKHQQLLYGGGAGAAGGAHGGAGASMDGSTTAGSNTGLFDPAARTRHPAAEGSADGTSGGAALQPYDAEKDAYASPPSPTSGTGFANSLWAKIGLGGAAVGAAGAAGAARNKRLKNKDEKLDAYFDPTATRGTSSAGAGGYEGDDAYAGYTYTHQQQQGNVEEVPMLPQQQRSAAYYQQRQQQQQQPQKRRESWGVLGVDVKQGTRLGAQSPIQRHIVDTTPSPSASAPDAPIAFPTAHTPPPQPIMPPTTRPETKVYAGLDPKDTLAYFAVGKAAAAEQQQEQQQEKEKHEIPAAAGGANQAGFFSQSLAPLHRHMPRPSTASNKSLGRRTPAAISAAEGEPVPDLPQAQQQEDEVLTSPKKFGFITSSPDRALSPTSPSKKATSGTGAAGGLGATIVKGLRRGSKVFGSSSSSPTPDQQPHAADVGTETLAEEKDKDAASIAAVSTLAGVNLSRANSFRTDGSHLGVNGNAQAGMDANAAGVHNRAKSDTSMLDAFMSNQIQYTSQPLPALPPEPTHHAYAISQPQDAAIMYAEPAAYAPGEEAPRAASALSMASMTSSNGGGVRRKPAPAAFDENGIPLNDPEAVARMHGHGQRSNSSGSLNRFIQQSPTYQQMNMQLQMMQRQQQQYPQTVNAPPSSWRRQHTLSNSGSTGPSPPGSSAGPWPQPPPSPRSSKSFTGAYDHYPSRYTHLDAPNQQLQQQQQGFEASANGVSSASASISAGTIPTLSSNQYSTATPSDMSIATLPSQQQRPGIPSGFRPGSANGHYAQRPRSSGSLSEQFVPPQPAAAAGVAEVRPLTGTQYPLRPTNKEQRHSTQLSLDGKNGMLAIMQQQGKQAEVLDDAAETDRIANGLWRAPGTLHIVNPGA